MDVRNSLGGISNGVKGYTTILLLYPSPLAVARATLAVAQNGQAARAGPTLSLKGRGDF